MRHVQNKKKEAKRLSLLLLLLSLLHDLLDNLLLLDQESANNTVLDAVGAARATVGTLDRLLGPRDLCVLARAEGWNLEGASVSVHVTLSASIAPYSIFLARRFLRQSRNIHILRNSTCIFQFGVGLYVRQPTWSHSHRILVQCLSS